MKRTPARLREGYAGGPVSEARDEADEIDSLIEYRVGLIKDMLCDGGFSEDKTRKYLECYDASPNCDTYMKCQKESYSLFPLRLHSWMCYTTQKEDRQGDEKLDDCLKRKLKYKSKNELEETCEEFWENIRTVECQEKAFSVPPNFLEEVKQELQNLTRIKATRMAKLCFLEGYSYDDEGEEKLMADEKIIKDAMTCMISELPVAAKCMNLTDNSLESIKTYSLRELIVITCHFSEYCTRYSESYYGTHQNYGRSSQVNSCVRAEWEPNRIERESYRVMKEELKQRLLFHVSIIIFGY